MQPCISGNVSRLCEDGVGEGQLPVGCVIAGEKFVQALAYRRAVSPCQAGHGRGRAIGRHACHGSSRRRRPNGRLRCERHSAALRPALVCAPSMPGPSRRCCTLRQRTGGHMLLFFRQFFTHEVSPRRSNWSAGASHSRMSSAMRFARRSLVVSSSSGVCCCGSVFTS